MAGLTHPAPFSGTAALAPLISKGSRAFSLVPTDGQGSSCVSETLQLANAGHLAGSPGSGVLACTDVLIPAVNISIPHHGLMTFA